MKFVTWQQNKDGAYPLISG